MNHGQANDSSNHTRNFSFSGRMWAFATIVAATSLSPPPPNLVGEAAAQATQQYRAAEDAAATLQSFSAEATATSYSATRSVVSVTEAAQSVASATAGASTATAESQVVRMTEGAMAVDATGTALWQGIEATRQSVSVLATATAEAQKARNDAALAADEARRVQQVRQAEAIRLERQQTFNNALPYLYGVVVFMGAIFFAFSFVALYKWISREPMEIQRPSAGGWVLVPGRNGYQVLSPPRLTARDEPMMLEEGVRAVEARPLPSLPDGHVLIVAESDGGKSTALREIIKHRENVVVLDPHYMPGAWGDVRVIGAGMDFESILTFMHHLYQEMHDRFQSRKNGQNQFPVLTVMTDEMPAISGSEVGRDVVMIWKQLIRQARKVNMFLIFSTQSTRVTTLGIKGEQDVLENFKHILELGKVAAGNYPELVAGMERAAVIRSSHYDPYPVVIPYDPTEDPDSPQFLGNTSQPHAPLFVASSAPRGVDTSWGYVEGWQVEMVLKMKGEGASSRAIEKAVFGYTGGHAYNMVTAVLEKCGATATAA